MSQQRESSGPLIHIGIHKALSSWLQSEVFGPDGPVYDLGLNHHVIQPAFVHCGDVPAPPWVAEMRDRAAAGEPVGMSCERLSGYPMMGLWSRRDIAHNLREAFPDAHILIVIREQRAALRSYYRQYIRDGGADSPSRLFLEAIEPHRTRRTSFDPDYFLYGRLHRLFVEFFGERNVSVLAYEQFIADAEGFVERLEHIVERDLDVDVGRRVNPARGPLQLSFFRSLNRFNRTQLDSRGVVRWSRPYAALDAAGAWLSRVPQGSMERRFSGRLDAAIAELSPDRYRKDNAQLAARLDLDLASLGYLC